MTRSLVLCMVFAIAVGLTAATAAGLSGWSWLATFAVYSATGSVALVAATFAGQVVAMRPVRLARSPDGRTERERALA